MPLHKNFPDSPHTIFDPAIRWFPVKVVDIFGNDTMTIVEVTI